MEADECDCKLCAPTGNGGSVCYHDEELGNRVDLEQTLLHQRPFREYTNEMLAQLLERGGNLGELLREELIKRLRSAAIHEAVNG